jgi:hypothetical protein
VMQALGDELLAGAALANDQDGPVERGGTARTLDRVEKRQALPDELICPLHCPDSWWQAPSVGKMFQRKIWQISAVFQHFGQLRQTGTDLVYLSGIQA